MSDLPGRFLNSRTARMEAEAAAKAAAEADAESIQRQAEEAENQAAQEIRSVLVINGGIELPCTKPVPNAWRRLWQWIFLGWEWEEASEEVMDGDFDG